MRRSLFDASRLSTLLPALVARVAPSASTTWRFGGGGSTRKPATRASTFSARAERLCATAADFESCQARLRGGEDSSGMDARIGHASLHALSRDDVEGHRLDAAVPRGAAYVRGAVDNARDAALLVAASGQYRYACHPAEGSGIPQGARAVEVASGWNVWAASGDDCWFRPPTGNVLALGSDGFVTVVESHELNWGGCPAGARE